VKHGWEQIRDRTKGEEAHVPDGISEADIF
jgi:hypothetical protein